MLGQALDVSKKKMGKGILEEACLCSFESSKSQSQGGIMWVYEISWGGKQGRQVLVEEQ